MPSIPRNKAPTANNASGIRWIMIPGWRQRLSRATEPRRPALAKDAKLREIWLHLPPGLTALKMALSGPPQRPTAPCR